MRKCFNPLGIVLVLLLAATGSVLAWSSTDVFDWPMHADTEKTMGWPTGTLRLVNDPRRVLGWHAWFSELPNSVYNFAYKPAANKRGTYLFVYPASHAGDYSRHRTGLQHLAFMVPTRGSVRAIHELVVALGNEVLHSPQEFPQYPPPYFATFWLDPFGIMLEAVCHHDRD